MTERAAAVRAVLRHVALGVEAAVARVSAQPFYAGLAEETVCITDTSSLRWNCREKIIKCKQKYVKIK